MSNPPDKQYFDTCPKCTREVPDGAITCEHCGYDLRGFDLLRPAPGKFDSQNLSFKHAVLVTVVFIGLCAGFAGVQVLFSDATKPTNQKSQTDVQPKQIVPVQSTQVPAPARSVLTTFTVGSISLGDSIEQHLSSLKFSAPDSQLSDCERTFHINGKTFAGVYFSLVQFGVRDGRIQKIYLWERTVESKVSGYRKDAIDFLNKNYGDYEGKRKDGLLPYGHLGRTHVNKWNTSAFTIELLTDVEGDNPYEDRFAKIEITVTAK